MGNTAYGDTSVSVDKSQGAIRKLLLNHDVEATRFTNYASHALIEFVKKVGTDQLIPYRIMVKPQVKKRYSGEEPTKAAIDRAERQVWRVAYWWLKSKMEAIDFGLVEFEEDFLPYMLIGDDSGGPPVTASQAFFTRIAVRLEARGDPWGGLRPALPPGDQEV